MAPWRTIALLAALSVAAGAGGRRRRREAPSTDSCDYAGSEDVTTIDAMFSFRAMISVAGGIQARLRVGGCENITVRVVGQRNVVQNLSMEDAGGSSIAVSLSTFCKPDVATMLDMCLPAAPSRVEADNNATVSVVQVDGPILANSGSYVYVELLAKTHVASLTASNGAAIRISEVGSDVGFVRAAALSWSQIYIGHSDEEIDYDVDVYNSVLQVVAPVQNLTASLRAAVLNVSVVDQAYIAGDKYSNAILGSVTTEIVMCTKLHLTYEGNATVVGPKAAKKNKMCKPKAALTV